MQQKIPPLTKDLSLIIYNTAYLKHTEKSKINRFTRQHFCQVFWKKKPNQKQKTPRNIQLKEAATANHFQYKCEHAMEYLQ